MHFTTGDQVAKAKQSIKCECNDTCKSGTVGSRKRVIQEYVCREIIGKLEALKHLYLREPLVAGVAASKKKSRLASEAFDNGQEVITELESKKAEQL